MKTLILGLGNPLRSDDGVGIAVVEALRQGTSILEDVKIIDGGTSALQALPFLPEYQQVFIIDAANMNSKPGEWRCIHVEEIALEFEKSGNVAYLHHMGLKEMISLGRSLQILPTDLYIYAIQPQTLQFSMSLSQSLAIAVKQVSQDILRRLG